VQIKHLNFCGKQNIILTKLIINQKGEKLSKNFSNGLLGENKKIRKFCSLQKMRIFYF